MNRLSLYFAVLSLLVLSVAGTGCLGVEKGTEFVHKQESVEEESTPSHGIAEQQEPERDDEKSKLTVLDLKKKYKSETSRAIMPLYNVKRDQTFTFHFNAPFHRIAPEDIISVHTDIQALPKSEIGSIVYFTENESVLDLQPLIGTLVSTETYGGYDGYWGNASIYYIRINYDMEADTPTKLDQPLIIPFTVKSEVPVPNLKYKIDSEGKLKLVWDEIEGVDGYKVYNSNQADPDKFGGPVAGSEEGYANQYPFLIDTVTDTEYDFRYEEYQYGPKNERLNSEQNFVGGDYYVTAYIGDKESNFSAGVSTHALGDKLPVKLVHELLFKEFDSLTDLPRNVQVKFINGSQAAREVVYDLKRIDFSTDGFRNPDVWFHIKGTDLRGVVYVNNVTVKDAKALKASQTKESGAGYVELVDLTDYIPDPDVPTIIGDEDAANAGKGTSSSLDLISLQKINTKNQVVEGNKESVPTPKIADEIVLNAESALEEYLARNLVDGKKRISLQAFPEAQNAVTLMDTLQKVIYQNPLILGVDRYGYDYESLMLRVTYEDSSIVMKNKQSKIAAEAKKIIASTIKAGMTEEEKRRAIYDYLDRNTVYDDDALESAEENHFRDVDARFNDSFTTYGILVKKIGVCMSYAYSYKLLGDLAGIETIVVTGKMDEVPHAWNKVKIGREWLNVDPTNGLTNAGVPYLLYNSNDKTAANLDYVQDELFLLDGDIEGYKGKSNVNDYYVVNGLELQSLTQYKSKLRELLIKGEPMIAVRLLADADEDQVMSTTEKVFSQVAEDRLDSAVLYELGDYIIIET